MGILGALDPYRHQVFAHLDAFAITRKLYAPFHQASFVTMLANSYREEDDIELT